MLPTTFRKQQETHTISTPSNNEQRWVSNAGKLKWEGLHWSYLRAILSQKSTLKTGQWGPWMNLWDPSCVLWAGVVPLGTRAGWWAGCPWEGPGASLAELWGWSPPTTSTGCKAVSLLCCSCDSSPQASLGFQEAAAGATFALDLSTVVAKKQQKIALLNKWNLLLFLYFLNP